MDGFLYTISNLILKMFEYILMDSSRVTFALCFVVYTIGASVECWK